MRITTYLRAIAIVAVTTAGVWFMSPFFDLPDLIMTYLLGIVVVATRHGRGPSLLAAVLSVAALDFFFVPPYFTFAVSDARHVFTFAVRLVVGFVISGLTVRIRAQAEVVTQRQLLHDVWGPNAGEQSHYLRVYMAHLRRKLEKEPARPRYLVTEPGVGYRLLTE